MTEEDSEEKSDIPDPTPNEQKNEEKKDESNSAVKTTAVTESNDDSDSNDEETEDPSAEFNAEPNAVEIVEPVSITFIEYKGSVAEDNLQDEGTIVKPIYLEGESGGQATSSDKLKFQLEVQDGWVAANLTVKYRVQNGENSDGTPKYYPSASYSSALTATDGTYTIDLNGDNGLKGAEKKKIFTGPIDIQVVADENTADLTVADGVTGGVYFVENGERGDLIAEDSTKSGVSFSKFTEEITLLVKAEEDDTVKIKIGSGATSDMTRGAEVEIGDVKWAEYTIDPKTLAGYADVATAAGAVFTVSKVAGADPAFAYALDEAPAKYTFGAITNLVNNVPDTDEIKYFTLKTTPSLAAPDAATKKTYLNTTVGTVDKRNVLVFTVAPAANTKYDITGVKAELTADDAPTAVLQTIEAGTGSYDVVDSDPVEYYVIDLGDIDSTLLTKAVTLTLKVDTTIKTEDDEFAVHKITFTGDLDNVEIKNAAGTEALATSTETEANDFAFSIIPKDGYAITTGTDYNGGGNSGDKVVTVSLTKRYELTDKDDATKKDYVETKVESKELSLGTPTSGRYQLGSDVTGFIDTNKLVLTATDNGWKDLVDDTEEANYAENSAAGGVATFSYKDITINIRTTTENNQSGSFTVDSDELEYTVETGNGVEPGDRANKYDISEEAEFVILNVTAPAGAPVVEYNVVSGSGTAATPVKDGDTYTVKIPVMSLSGSNGDGVSSAINSIITIRRGTYAFTVVDGSDADFAGNIKVYDYNGAYTGSSAMRDIPKGDTIPVILTAPTGTEFATVKVETGTGADKKTEEITLGENKGKVELSLAMTADVKVVVTTSDIYNVTLTREGGTISQDENGVYVVPFGAKNIVTALKNGSTPKQIAYAKLYDGGQEAATKVSLMTTSEGTSASVSNDAAKIAAIDSKDTGVLRLDLAVKNGNKLVVVSSVQIKQEQMASKISITDPYDGSAVTEFNQAPDTKTATYNVKAEEGSLAFDDSTVVMELAADAARTTGTQATLSTGVYTIDNNDVTIAFDPSAGTLDITAKPSVTGDKSYVLRFYDKTKRAEAAKTNAADRICAVEGGTIDVKIAPPAVKTANLKAEALDATNTTLKIKVSSDKIALNPNNSNGVFYRVTLGSNDTFGVGYEAISTEKTQYIEVDNTKEYQVVEFRVNPEHAKNKDNTCGDEYSDPKEFHPTVELVQTTVNADIKTESKLAKSDAIALTTSTKEARYETELTLSPAKATVYLGQVSTVATKAQFGEKTGFTGNIVTEFVNTKTNKNVTTLMSNYGMTAIPVNETGEIKISATGVSNSSLKNNPADFKDLGLRVYATAPGATKKASAVLALSVVAGVKNISFENGYNQEIYKVSGKKATLKIKAVLNDGVKENAPKKKKFVYALGDKNGNLPGEDGYTVPSVAVMGNVTVNKTNGTVTVAKGFEVDAKTADNNKFSVVAQEIYSGAKAAVKVTITGTAQAVTSVVIVDGNGKIVAADGVLRADDFYDGTTPKKLYVKALSATAGAKREYDVVGVTAANEMGTNGNYMTGVKYTSSAKNVLSVDPRNGELKLLKASNKPVKLTVAAADGSKSKGQTISITVQSYSAVGLNVSNNAYKVNTTADESVVKYDGAMNAQFTLYPMVKVNGKWATAPSDYFKNLNIAVKKAKKVKLEKTATRWSIIKTDSVSTVTISDKSNKSVKAAYDIAQNPAAPAGAKALKVKSLTKLTQPMVESARNAADSADGTIKIKYQITGTDKGLYTGQYIMLTPDYTKTKEVLKQKEYVRAQKNFFGYEYDAELDRTVLKNYVIKKVGADDTFEVDLDMWHQTNEQKIPGSYTLIATAGTYAGGTFTPATKGASIKVKIPGKAPKSLSLKLNGSYSLDESGAPVSIETGISSGLAWSLTDPTDGNFAKNMIDAETGKANSFTKYFEVKQVFVNDNPVYDKNGNGVYTLGLKSGLTVDEIAKLRENEKDRQGYVTVVTSDQRQDMQITVNITDSVITGVAKDSYKGGEASVQFYANGEAIEIAGVSIDQKASQGTPSFANASKPVDETDHKTVKVKLGAAEKDNSYEVTFKVLAANSAYATAVKANGTSETINNTYVEKYGRTVTATFKVVDPAKTKGSVWFEAVDQNVGLAFTAYSAATYDKAKNTYSLDIEQKSEIDGAVISTVKIGKNNEDGSAFAGTNAGLNIKTVNGSKTKFTLTLDRDKFLKLADAENATLARGAELAIPVEVTYSNREIPAETISVKVTMPDPMDVDAAVDAAKAAITEAEQIRVIDLDNRDAAVGTIMDKLTAEVNKVLLKAVPMDVLADVNLPITLTEETDTKVTPNVTTWEADVVIKAKKTDKDADAKLKYTLKFAPETKMLTAAELVTAINGLTITEASINGIANNDHKVDNDYTADMLKADVLKLLAAANKSVPSDLEVVIKDFKIKKATVSANGKVTAAIAVYDAKTKKTTPVNTVNIDITALGTIGTNGTLIDSAVTGFDYQTVIYNALKDGGISTVESALEDAITKAATGAIRNSNVTVEFEAITVTSANLGNFDNADLVAGTDNTKNVWFKLPSNGSNQSNAVQFKLVVKQSGMKDYTINKTSGITVNAAMTIGGKSVNVFQTLNGAKTEVAKAKASGGIFTTGGYTGSETALADKIDKKTKAAIETEVAKRAKTLVSGVGLDVTAEVTSFTATDDSTAANESALGGADALHAHGTITITDESGRTASGSNVETLDFVVEIPANADKATVSSMTVTATKKIGSAAAVDAPITSNAIAAIENISTENVVIKFTPELSGYWLADANKKFTYKLMDPDDTDNELGTIPTGVTLTDNGTLTIATTSVDPATREDTTDGLKLAVKVTHDTTGGTYPDGYTAKTQTISVTIKFTTPASAVAILKGSGYLSTIKVQYAENAAGDDWEITDAAKTALAAAVQTKLRTEAGYTGFTVTVKSAALTDGDYSNSTAPTKADVEFTVKSGTEQKDTGTINNLTAEAAPAS